MDGGEDNTFVTDPADEASFGSHGEGIWRSCDDGLDVGVNARRPKRSLEPIREWFLTT